MARTPRSHKAGETLEHKEATRTNIPTAGHQSIKDREQRDLMRVGCERRSRDLDSQLVWRKDEQDWAVLVVQAPPLYIQQKVHPKVLVDDLMRRTEVGERAADAQPDLFADFNGFTNYADLYKYLHRLVFTRKVS